MLSKRAWSTNRGAAGLPKRTAFENSLKEGSVHDFRIHRENKNRWERRAALARRGDIHGTRLVLTIKQETPTGAMETSRLMLLGDKGRIQTTVLTITDSSGQRKANEFYTN